MRPSLTVGALILALFLAGCGQKGDLYLPDKSKTMQDKGGA